MSLISAEQLRLLNKYKGNVPRYTSYPTVPHWQKEPVSITDWHQSVLASYDSSRGLSLYIHLPYCESLCTFCGCNKRITKNRSVQQPYIDSLLNEWQQYRRLFGHKPVLKQLHLGGGTPTFMSASILKELLSTILSEVQLADNHSFSFEAHPSSTTIDHLTTLKSFGFNRISIGVQDVSDKIMKAINRKQTLDQVKWLSKTARAVGYKINYDLVYGLPFQDLKNISANMDLLAELRPDRIAFYSYAHVPWKSKGQRAFGIGDFKQGVDKYELFTYGKNRMLDMGYKSLGFDHFALESDNLYKAYKKGKMSRNFMGFIDEKITCNIGLGTSAISETKDMYVQNSKEVEAYQAQVDKNNLAIFRGHSLSPTDQIMKKHIEQLCCNAYTSWVDYSMDSICLGPFLDRLTAFEQDNMLVYDNNHIQILDKGKPFVRNIVAAIDPYMLQHSSTQNLFSNAV